MKKAILIILLLIFSFIAFLLYKPFTSQFKTRALLWSGLPIVYSDGVYMGASEYISVLKIANLSSSSSEGFNKLIKKYIWSKKIQEQGIAKDDLERQDRISGYVSDKEAALALSLMDAAHRAYSASRMSEKEKFADMWKKVDSANNELAKGTPFTTVAKKYSEDEATKSLGGLVGYLPADRFVPEVEAILPKLVLNKPSTIVTSNGVQIVKLVDINQKSTPVKYEVYVIYFANEQITDIIDKEVSSIGPKFFFLR